MGFDIRDIRNPKLVWCIDIKLAVQRIVHDY